MMKKNFQVDDKVCFVQTADANLDGQTGAVLGRSFVGITDSYIVLFDKPLTGYPDKAISIVEACLELVTS